MNGGIFHPFIHGRLALYVEISSNLRSTPRVKPFPVSFDLPLQCNTGDGSGFGSWNRAGLHQKTSALHTKVDVESQTTPKDGGEEPRFTRKGYMENHPAQVVEEEIPRSFEGHKDGIIKLYNWFYRFTQWKLGGIADNMTPREFVSIVSGRIPSEGAPALEYLVTSFEIANYSKISLTKEILFKCSKGVEMLKDLIEGGGSQVSDDFEELDETSLALSAHNV